MFPTADINTFNIIVFSDFPGDFFGRSVFLRHKIGKKINTVSKTYFLIIKHGAISLNLAFFLQFFDIIMYRCRRLFQLAGEPGYLGGAVAGFEQADQFWLKIFHIFCRIFNYLYIFRLKFECYSVIYIKETPAEIGMKHKRIGIISGLGPASDLFCLNLSRELRKLSGKQPEAVIEHLAVSQKTEEEFVRGNNPKLMFRLLKEAVRSLNRSRVELIAIPCNSVHVFIEKLREISVAPILSIMEETGKECAGLRKIGLLATKQTINQNLFQKWLSGNEIIVPDKIFQTKVNNCISRILNNANKDPEREEAEQLREVIRHLIDEGAEAIILGCTDLSLVHLEDYGKGNLENFPLIDTCKILQEAVLGRICGTSILKYILKHPYIPYEASLNSLVACQKEQ